MNTVKQTVTALETALTELADRARRQSEQLDRALERADRLERRLARGTMDGQQVATRKPPAVIVEPTLAEDLERVLRAQPISTADAALLLGVPVSHVAVALRALRRTQSVVNAGTSEQPLWSWVLGDEGSTTELVAKVEQLLRLRPMTLQELAAITGARRNRISGALVILRRHGVHISNEGNGWRAVWSIAPKPRKR